MLVGEPKSCFAIAFAPFHLNVTWSLASSLSFTIQSSDLPTAPGSQTRSMAAVQPVLVSQISQASHGAPLMHEPPPSQASPVVHALLSVHGVFTGSSFARQLPLPLQVSGSVQSVSAGLPHDVPEGSKPHPLLVPSH